MNYSSSESSFSGSSQIWPSRSMSSDRIPIGLQDIKYLNSISEEFSFEDNQGNREIGNVANSILDKNKRRSVSESLYEKLGIEKDREFYRRGVRRNRFRSRDASPTRKLKRVKVWKYPWILRAPFEGPGFIATLANSFTSNATPADVIETARLVINAIELLFDVPTDQKIPFEVITLCGTKPENYCDLMIRAAGGLANYRTISYAKIDTNWYIGRVDGEEFEPLYDPNEATMWEMYMEFLQLWNITPTIEFTRDLSDFAKQKIPRNRVVNFVDIIYKEWPLDHRTWELYAKIFIPSRPNDLLLKMENVDGGNWLFYVLWFLQIFNQYYQADIQQIGRGIIANMDLGSDVPDHPYVSMVNRVTNEWTSEFPQWVDHSEIWIEADQETLLRLRQDALENIGG